MSVSIYKSSVIRPLKSYFELLGSCKKGKRNSAMDALGLLCSLIETFKVTTCKRTIATISFDVLTPSNPKMVVEAYNMHY